MSEELENKWRKECSNPYNVNKPESVLSYYIYQAAYVTGRYDSQQELETTKKLLDEAITLIEEMCVDDCGIDLAKEDKESLEAIIVGNDEKCQKFLAKLKTKNNGN